MSTLTQAGEQPVRARAWRAALFVTSAVVLALAVAEFINLMNVHTVGAEIYGLLQREVQRVYVINRTSARAEALQKGFGQRVRPAGW